MSVFAPPERPVGLPKGTTDAVLERLFPAPNPFERDPVGWIGGRLHEQLWAKQREIADAVVENGHVAVPSCHSSGKSYLAARLAAWWIDSHPIGEARVVTSAPTQHQVKTVLWGEIAAAKRKGDLPGHIGQGQVPEWKIDEQIIAFGRKPADVGTPEQAMQSFQGIHAPYVLVILDEACGIEQWLFDAAETLATGENDRILAIGNPDDPSSYFAEVCRPGSGWKVIPIDAFETPRFTGEDIDERIPLISRRWVEERGKRWGEDSPRYQSKVRGRFPDVSNDTLFPPKLVRRAEETDLPGVERGGYGIDWARYGDSETAIYRNRGGVLRLVATARMLDTVEGADFAEGILAQHGADNIPAVSDAVGLGAGPTDMLRHRGKAVIAFNGADRAYDDELFANRRAETYWILRKDMEAGLVDLDPLDEELLSQLGSLKWKLDSKGRILIESKEDMRKRGMPSPDRADAAAMAYASPTMPLEPLEDDPIGEVSITGDLLERPM